MRSLYQYSGSQVLWGYTSQSLIKGEFLRSTREYLPLRELQVSKSMPHMSKTWTVYKCKSCDFLTHAISTLPSKDPEVAIVANLPVGTHATRRLLAAQIEAASNQSAGSGSGSSNSSSGSNSSNSGSGSGVSSSSGAVSTTSPSESQEQQQ
jgi:uncharacterized membrane protein YgcG